MKALSLWQPWATLMALGLKKIETRSWPTKYRGPLAIHAALEMNKVQVAIGEIYLFRKALASVGLKRIEDLPRGGIIASLDLMTASRSREARQFQAIRNGPLAIIRLVASCGSQRM